MQIKELTVSALGRDAKLRVFLRDNMGYAPNVAMYLDSGKLRRLGWCAEVSMVEGYKRLIEYIKEHDVSCDVFEE